MNYICFAQFTTAVPDRNNLTDFQATDTTKHQTLKETNTCNVKLNSPQWRCRIVMGIIHNYHSFSVGYYCWCFCSYRCPGVNWQKWVYVQPLTYNTPHSHRQSGQSISLKDTMIVCVTGIQNPGSPIMKWSTIWATSA